MAQLREDWWDSSFDSPPDYAYRYAPKVNETIILGMDQYKQLVEDQRQLITLKDAIKRLVT